MAAYPRLPQVNSSSPNQDAPIDTVLHTSAEAPGAWRREQVDTARKNLAPALAADPKMLQPSANCDVSRRRGKLTKVKECQPIWLCGIRDRRVMLAANPIGTEKAELPRAEVEKSRERAPKLHGAASCGFIWKRASPRSKI